MNKLYEMFTCITPQASWGQPTRKLHLFPVNQILQRQCLHVAVTLLFAKNVYLYSFDSLTLFVIICSDIRHKLSRDMTKPVFGFATR